MIEDLLSMEFYGNTLMSYGISIAVFIGGSFILYILKRVVLARLQRLAKERVGVIFGVLVATVRKYLLPILTIVLLNYSITSFLVLAKKVGEFVHGAFIVLIAFFGARFAVAFIRLSIKTYLVNADREKDEVEIDRSLGGLTAFINIVVWIIAVLFVLANLGFNISAVIAGLGIGGVALALASQHIFKDLFNYFVIFFDRPFQAGDFIILDDKMGTIEKIGIKTTRITSLSGEQIIMSNTDLADARIHNYKKMEKRRVQFSFGVLYQTGLKELREIPGIIREIVDRTEFATFDRAHFKEYGDSSLDFEVVYYVDGPEYNRYMDIQQEINLAIFEEFEARGIGFAYPTRTVFIEKQ